VNSTTHFYIFIEENKCEKTTKRGKGDTKKKTWRSLR
jgi:hypothetical protein